MGHLFDWYEWLFSVLSGTGTYLLIDVGKWMLFKVRARRRLRYFNLNCYVARDTTNYPCKLHLDFRNWTNNTVLLKLEGFRLYPGVAADPKAFRDSTSGLLEVKFIEHTAQGNAVDMNVDSIIRHSENRTVWVPLDPAQDDVALGAALREGRIGELRAEMLWLGSGMPKLFSYRPDIRGTGTVL